jgi:ubiquinone/menaquinone biosynthesis C-methylase UbiE
MIAQAQARLGDKARLVQGAADRLPFEDASFHAVSINQVVHHFPPDNNFEYLSRCFQEAARVLKPGGIFVINTSTPEQQRDAFWWLELFEHSQSAICSRFPPLDVVLGHLRGAGFHVNDDSVTVPLHRPLMASEKYLEKGIACGLDKNYQDGDSSWAMADKFGETEQAMQKIKSMISQGTDGQYLQRKEQQRLGCGQATFVTATML